uniref:Uncharacterized protein n=1 Tax=Steinernema glaseri TaxID=37863 RepID=A0A1I8AFH2_9BILA
DPMISPVHIVPE